MIRGTIHNFGRWGRVVGGKLIPVEDYEAGWRDALKRYKDQADHLHAGRTAPCDRRRAGGQGVV